LQTKVKKWFKDKGFGFLENGSGPDIMVRKSELIKCSYLKVGSFVQFECHFDKQGLTAKKVSILRKNHHPQNGAKPHRKNPFGVMT
jgi:cold shock CspA family protein